MEPKSTPRVRLNKAIADSGLASRRQADRLIEEGSVTVNGKKVYELGIKVEPNKDKIFVAGKPLKAKGQAVYAVLHKPKGMLTTMEDPEGRPTIKQYLEDLPVRLFPVGRLDWDSEGLLLLTNDGDWAQKVMRPDQGVTKTYLVKVKGDVRPEALQKLRTGVSIVGGKVAAKFVDKIERGKDKYQWLKIVITEGKNRQIRLMFEKVGLDVMKLQRVAIGRMRLGSIERGQLVFLNETAAASVFQPDMSGTEDKRGSTVRQQSLKKNPLETAEDIEDVVVGAKTKKNSRSKKPNRYSAGRRFKGMPLTAKTEDGAPASRRKTSRDAKAARTSARSTETRPSEPRTGAKIKGTKRKPAPQSLNLDDLE